MEHFFPECSHSTFFFFNMTLSVPNVFIRVLNFLPHQLASDRYRIDINPFLASVLHMCFQLDVLFTFFLVVQNCKVKFISIHVKLRTNPPKTPAKLSELVSPGSTYLFPAPVSPPRWAETSIKVRLEGKSSCKRAARSPGALVSQPEGKSFVP